MLEHLQKLIRTIVSLQKISRVMDPEWRGIVKFVPAFVSEKFSTLDLQEALGMRMAGIQVKQEVKCS